LLTPSVVVSIVAAPKWQQGCVAWFDPRDKVAAHICFDDPPPLWSFADQRHCHIEFVEKSFPQAVDTALVVFCRFDYFCFSVKMVDNSHSRARCAATMTSSWLRAVTATEDSSSFLRIASAIAFASSASASPSLILSTALVPMKHAPSWEGLVLLP